MSESQIKSFVMLHKKSANIFEGYRICFTDAKRFENETPAPEGWKITMVPYDDCDGWLMSNPLPESGLGNFKIFMNREWVEESFENLGEL